jgi:hypothetical protein
MNSTEESPPPRQPPSLNTHASRTQTSATRSPANEPPSSPRKPHMRQRQAAGASTPKTDQAPRQPPSLYMNFISGQSLFSRKVSREKSIRIGQRPSYVALRSDSLPRAPPQNSHTAPKTYTAEGHDQDPVCTSLQRAHTSSMHGTVHVSPEPSNNKDPVHTSLQRATKPSMHAKPQKTAQRSYGPSNSTDARTHNLQANSDIRHYPIESGCASTNKNNADYEESKNQRIHTGDGDAEEHVHHHVSYDDKENYTGMWTGMWRSVTMVLVLFSFAFVFYGKFPAAACIAWTMVLSTVVQGVCQARHCVLRICFCSLWKILRMKRNEGRND